MSLFEEFDLIAHIHDGEGDGSIHIDPLDAEIEPCLIVWIGVRSNPKVDLHQCTVTWLF